MYNILNVIASNAAFGSSSKRISLSLAIVLQIASRCHCPPDNCTPFSNQYPICCFGLSQIESEDAIDAVVEQSQENAKRLMEKETNEKIMAINEYSNTVIESMNKTHNEILFLYNMLNDKHTELTGLASQLQQFSEQVKHTQDEMMTHLTETVKEPEPARTEVSEPVEEQPQQISPKASVAEETDNGSFNDQVLALHQNGVSDVEIARKLGRGLGEVKLVIGLYKGEDVSEI